MAHAHHSMDYSLDAHSHFTATLASTASNTLPAAAAAAATSTSSSSSYSHSETGSMAMFFTTSYQSPVLFSSLTPTNAASATGLGILIFLLAIAYRGLVFLRAYLEATYWSPPHHSTFTAYGEDVGAEKGRHGRGITQPFSLRRDAGRMGMAFLVALVGYALMLIVMSFVVVWFFAVVIGLAVGEFIFARLSAGGNGSHGGSFH